MAETADAVVERLKSVETALSRAEAMAATAGPEAPLDAVEKLERRRAAAAMTSEALSVALCAQDNAGKVLHAFALLQGAEPLPRATLASERGGRKHDAVPRSHEMLTKARRLRCLAAQCAARALAALQAAHRALKLDVVAYPLPPAAAPSPNSPLAPFAPAAGVPFSPPRLAPPAVGSPLSPMRGPTLAEMIIASLADDQTCVEFATIGLGIPAAS